MSAHLNIGGMEAQEMENLNKITHTSGWGKAGDGGGRDSVYMDDYVTADESRMSAPGGLGTNSVGEENNPLFWPIKVGDMQLKHRVVLAPLTRCRALDGNPQAAHVEYYSQRASPGGLVITEATSVGPTGHGFPHSPGIYTEEQRERWKEVVDAVHAKGAFIFLQIWHVGRASHYCHQPNGAAPVSSTSKAIQKPGRAMIGELEYTEYPHPRALETDELAGLVTLFRMAARYAVDCGFDGVEIHSAHGYLLDQFLKDGINDRTDQYGGSIENRCRFVLEVVASVIEEIGAHRTSIRISPIIDHNGANDSDPEALGLYLIQKLNEFGLAYLTCTEPRFYAQGIKETDKNTQIYKTDCKCLFMSTGGYTRETGMEAIRSGHANLISYGRLFIANPDLPLRFALDSELNKYDRSSFYRHDQKAGYTDYPFLDPLQPRDSTERDLLTLRTIKTVELSGKTTSSVQDPQITSNIRCSL